jgi:3-isopropylmalate/(R)-2-methylmalate dehydratase small subunit
LFGHRLAVLQERSGRGPTFVVVELRQLLDQRGAQLTVDLPNQAVTGPDGKTHQFEIEPLSKRRLLKGLDEIANTKEYSAAIRKFEEEQKESFPWLYS